MARQGLSKRIRFEVFKRDQFTCQYCGHRPPDVLLQVDHVIAVAKGGSNDPDNLVTSCATCNAGKSDRPLNGLLPVIDEMARLEAMQEMAERAVTLKQQKEVAVAQQAATEEAMASCLGWWEQIGGTADNFQRGSILKFIRDLSVGELYEAFQIAGAHWERKPWLFQGQAWRYFCGVCWQMIRGNR